MDTGQIIAILRKRKELSQAELAKLTNITQASLSHIESGKKLPHKSTIEKICTALGIPSKLFFLLTLTEKDLPDESKEKFSMIEKDLKDLILNTF